MQKNNFNSSANEYSGVKEHDPAKLWLAHFSRALRGHLLLMAPGDAKLEDAQQSDGEQEEKKSDDGYVHCSSKNSALNPGPKAAASA